MKHFFVIILTLSTKLLFGQMFGSPFDQNRATTDFFAQIKDYDLSVVWTADSVLANEDEMRRRAEILGFIGDNYQRLHVRFISIIQNPFNPYEYFAYGKTKVEENIRSFQGTIKITKARLYDETDTPVDVFELPDYKQGYVESEVILFEDSKEESTGFFSGKLTTGFLIDDRGEFRYAAIMFYSDWFNNNQFVGIWTSYHTNLTKRAHWGDWRIPESGDLDIGAGEFSVNPKYYAKNGWENWVSAWGYPEPPSSEKERQKAREKEKEQWWK